MKRQSVAGLISGGLIGTSGLAVVASAAGSLFGTDSGCAGAEKRLQPVLSSLAILDQAPPGATLVARFWHPSLRRWSESPFESLEHALHLFVDESGWVLRQQQALDGPHAFELVFEARREDFSRPSAEAMLQDVGLSAEDVADLIERVERENGTDEQP